MFESPKNALLGSPETNESPDDSHNNCTVSGSNSESARSAEPSLNDAPRPMTVTREALELATKAESNSLLARSITARNLSRGPSPASFAETNSTVPVPTRKRARLSDLAGRPVRSNCPSVSYHCAGLQEESAVDNNATEEDLTARVTYRDPANPSFILRRG